MNIFEQYGIKEVADVCLYSIELDENDDEVYVPVLYLDTLKVSTIEETAEQTSARGGLGNPELIIWDYGKEITVNLEDALYSPASQGMTWGGKHGTKHFSLRGEMREIEQVENGWIETGENIPVKIIIKDFSDFKKINKTPSTFYYKWDVTINIMSDDQQINIITKKFSLFYNKEADKWTIELNTKIIDDIMMGDVNQDGTVDVADVVKLNLFLLDPTKTSLTPKGVLAADVTEPFITEVEKQKLIEKSQEAESLVNEETEGVDQNDSLILLNYVVMIITRNELGEKKYKLCVNEKDFVPPQEVIYQIDHALQNVHFLDRMEKCIATQTFCIDTDINTAHGNYRYLQQYSQCELTVFIDPRTMQPYEPNTDKFIRKNGKEKKGRLRIIKQHEIYYKWTRSKAIDNTSLGSQIIVDAIHFPGTYRLVGETYSRSRKTGKDQRYQFEIPLCKMGTENNLTLQADGDPTTFNMTLKVLRREDGVMMKLTQFDVAPAKYDGYTSDSTVVVPGDEVVPTTPENTGVV